MRPRGIPDPLAAPSAMRGHARGRLGAASGPPPRGPWVPGRARLRGLLRRLLSPLRCPPPTRPPPTRAGSPLGGLSAGGLSAALSRRFVSAPRRALPRPLGPRFGGSGRGRGYAPAAGVFVLFARHSAGRPAGGIPAGAFACGLVRGGAPAPLPRPGAPALREICLAGCVCGCGCRPRGAPCAVAPPLGGSALARRALAVGIVARAATAAGLLAALCSEGPRYAGRAVAAIAAFFVRPPGAPAGRSGLPRARALCARPGGSAALAGPSLPAPRGAPFGCLRRVRSVPKGPLSRPPLGAVGC